MVPLPADAARLVADAQQSVDLADVLEWEDDPHITIRYGLHTSDPGEVRRTIATEGFGPFPVSVSDGIGSFPGGDQDVLFLGVVYPRSGPSVAMLHQRLAVLPYTDSHDDYIPHVTVAYLRPGTAAKYTRRGFTKTVQFVADSVVFADADGNESLIQLGDAVAFAEDKQGHDHGGDGRFVTKGSGGPSAPHESHSLDGLEAKLPAGSDPAKARTLAGKAHRAVYDVLTNASPHLMQLLPEVIDTADDLFKLSYAKAHDEFLQATGVPFNTGAAIASHVLSRAAVWAKHQVKGPKKMADDATERNKLARELVEAVAKAMGLPPPSGEPSKMVDDAPPPLKDTTALAGSDGHELARLIRQSIVRGAGVLSDITRDAAERAIDAGGIGDSLFTEDERQRLADTLAAVNSSADLLGRARIREQADATAAVPFSTVSKFADDPGVLISTPESALDYFSGLVPSLNLDPERFGEFQRRKAFTLAASTEDVLTTRVQAAITEALREHESTAAARKRIDDLLDEAGVGSRQNAYATMVFRTNAQDSYQQAHYEEARSPDLHGTFPVWKYLGLRDGRQGKDHEPKFGRYYPAEATFADVRGPRPFNCRCSMEWLTNDEWDDLQRQGARVEQSW